MNIWFCSYSTWEANTDLKDPSLQDVQTKVSDVVLGKEKPVEETDPEYEKLKHYIFGLEDHLAETQKQAFRLVKRHRGSIFRGTYFINYLSCAVVWSVNLELMVMLCAFFAPRTGTVIVWLWEGYEALRCLRRKFSWKGFFRAWCKVRVVIDKVTEGGALLNLVSSLFATSYVQLVHKFYLMLNTLFSCRLTTF